MPKITALVLVYVLAFALALTGCAGKQTPTFNAQYYPECYEPIKKLEEDQSNAQEVKGAVGGALLGALGGAVIGGLASGDWRGAAIGAAAGAVAGGVAGYYKAHLDKIADQNQRLAEYQNLLGEQSKGWDLERASIEKAYQCYSQQMDTLKRMVQAKQITRQSFIDRTNEIKSGIDHINTYWAKAEERMNSSFADGDNWLAEQEKLAKDREQKAALQAARKKSQSVTSAAKKSNQRTQEISKDTNEKLTALLKQADEGSNWALWDEAPLPEMCMAQARLGV